ncbi:hypothetical protein cypCar_00000099 [Cyprinus carpio]|nr:hypothetical protein cypCar_00000099 [Cyprinus carpio]
MSDWEDEYDADGVEISKPLPVQTVPVMSWRPQSPRGARSRETASVGAKFGGDGEQQWRDLESTLSQKSVMEQPVSKSIESKLDSLLDYDSRKVLHKRLLFDACLSALPLFELVNAPDYAKASI